MVIFAAAIRIYIMKSTRCLENAPFVRASQGGLRTNACDQPTRPAPLLPSWLGDNPEALGRLVRRRDGAGGTAMRANRPLAERDAVLDEPAPLL